MSVAKLSPQKEPLTLSPAAQRGEESVKVTLYINQQVLKEFKKRAIDEGVPYSELAELAFSEYLKNDGN